MPPEESALRSSRRGDAVHARRRAPGNSFYLINIGEYSPNLAQISAMAAKPIEKGCTITADRGVVLALPDTVSDGLLFGAGLLAPKDQVNRVSSGMFEITASAQRIKALDVVTVGNGVRALVVGVADGDIAPLAAMKGVYLAVVHLPLQRMANRYKNEIDTHYINGEAVTLLEPRGGLKVSNVDGFVRAFAPYNNLFKDAAALERHCLLDFSAQLQLIVDKAIEFIAKDVQSKHSGQPGVRSKALLERQGLVNQHHHALAKRGAVYGRPLDERFKLIPTPNTTDVNTDLPTTAEQPTPAATASLEGQDGESAAAGKEGVDCGSKGPPAASTSVISAKTVATPSPSAPPATPSPPQPPPPPPPPQLLTLATLAAAPAPAPSGAAATAGTLPPASVEVVAGEVEPEAAEEDEVADAGADADESSDGSEFGPMDEFFRVKPKDRSKQARKKRGGEGMSVHNIMPAQKRRAVLKVPPLPTQPAPTADSAAPESMVSGRAIKGPGTRGGPGKYFTFSKAKEVQDAVRQGKAVSTPDKLKAMAKLGCKELLSPPASGTARPESVISLGAYPSQSVSQVSDDKYEELREKYEKSQKECTDLRIKNAEATARARIAEGKASMLEASKNKAEQLQDKARFKVELQLEKAQQDLAELRKKVQAEFERGLQMGIKAASTAK